MKLGLAEEWLENYVNNRGWCESAMRALLD